MLEGDSPVICANCEVLRNAARFPKTSSARSIRAFRLIPGFISLLIRGMKKAPRRVPIRM